MKDKNSNIHLLAGDLVILPNTEGIISTLLGSCVAIIFHVPNKVSMACHALLPHPKSNFDICGSNCPKPCEEVRGAMSEYRYVTCSIKRMISELQRLHIHPSQVHVSLIGGANVLDFVNEETIGVQNIRTAREMLKSCGFTIRREHTGGINGCNVVFHTSTNTLLIKVHGGSSAFELGDNFSASFQPRSNAQRNDELHLKLKEELDKLKNHFNK